MPESEEYLRGLRDGEIRALETALGKVQAQLDKHETRITAQERITYSLLAVIAFIQFAPALTAFLTGN